MRKIATICYYAATESGYKYVGWEKFDPKKYLQYRSWMRSGNAVKVNRTTGKSRFYNCFCSATFILNEL